MKFRPFADIEELITWLKQYRFVYYHAPMDCSPFSVRVKRYTIDNENASKSKATLWTSVNGTFQVNLEAHFDRFKVREDRPCND